MVYSTFQVFYVLVDLLSSCSSHYINGILLLTCVVLMICKSQPQFQELTIWGEDGALVLLSWATSSLLPDKGLQTVYNSVLDIVLGFWKQET